MLKYILKRILMLIPVLIGVTLTVFIIMRVFSPDPTLTILGEKYVTEQQRENCRKEFGLDKPIHEQYIDFVLGAVKGDFGKSYKTKLPVSEELFRKFPATVELAIVAIILSSIFGVIIGVFSAVKKNTIFDYLGTFISLIGISIPIFWLGIMFIIYFAQNLHWLPSGGRISDNLSNPNKVTGLFLIDYLLSGNMAGFIDALRHIIMPGVVLSISSLAITARMTRSSMLDTLNQDYIRTARAKGLPEKTVVIKHALRNALIPIITVIGLQFGGLLGGAVLTENVFTWPGVGKWAVDAINDSDFPIVQAVVVLTGTVFVLVNLFVDIIYAFLDPRIKFSKKGE